MHNKYIFKKMENKSPVSKACHKTYQLGSILEYAQHSKTYQLGSILEYAQHSKTYQLGSILEYATK